ncbi:MAG: hypothetical protein RJA36_3083 [Pseudomonadota bacterium]|jgi:hypothetical protein
MDGDLGNPPLLMFLLTLAALVLAVVVEARLRRRLALYVPPLPRWLPVLVSVPACLLVLLVVAVGGAELLHRL